MIKSKSFSCLHMLYANREMMLLAAMLINKHEELLMNLFFSNFAILFFNASLYFYIPMGLCWGWVGFFWLSPRSKLPSPLSAEQRNDISPNYTYLRKKYMLLQRS